MIPSGPCSRPRSRRRTGLGGTFRSPAGKTNTSRSHCSPRPGTLGDTPHNLAGKSGNFRSRCSPRQGTSAGTLHSLGDTSGNSPPRCSPRQGTTVGFLLCPRSLRSLNLRSRRPVPRPYLLSRRPYLLSRRPCLLSRRPYLPCPPWLLLRFLLRRARFPRHPPSHPRSRRLPHPRFRRPRRPPRADRRHQTRCTPAPQQARPQATAPCVRTRDRGTWFEVYQEVTGSPNAELAVSSRWVFRPASRLARPIEPASRTPVLGQTTSRRAGRFAVSTTWTRDHRRARSSSPRDPWERP